MKKIALFLILLLAPAVSHAAECSVSFGYIPDGAAYAEASGAKYVFSCTGAGDGSVDDTQFTNLGRMRGWYLYMIRTEPGSGGAEPTAYTVDIQDADDFSVVDLSARSTTAIEIASAHDTLGIFPQIIESLFLVVGNLGADNTAEITVTIVK